MAGASVQVEVDVAGLKLAEPMIRKLVAGAIFETASKIAADTKRRVPVDRGDLRAKYHVEQGPGSGPIGEPLPTELDAVVGNHLVYAAAQEFGATIRITPAMRRFFWYMAISGFRTRRKAPWNTPEAWRNLALTKKTHVRIPKHPALRPAYHQNRRLLKARIEAKLKRL